MRCQGHQNRSLINTSLTRNHDHIPTIATDAPDFDGLDSDEMVHPHTSVTPCLVAEWPMDTGNLPSKTEVKGKSVRIFTSPTGHRNTCLLSVLPKRAMESKENEGL